MLQCVAVCCSVLQCVAVCCSVLQCVAVAVCSAQVVARCVCLCVSVHIYFMCLCVYKYVLCVAGCCSVLGTQSIFVYIFILLHPTNSMSEYRLNSIFSHPTHCAFCIFYILTPYIPVSGSSAGGRAARCCA